MRKIEIVLTFIIGFLLCLVIYKEPILLGNDLLNKIEVMEEGTFSGFYDHDYEWIICNDESSCFHEVGHWIDANKGYISDTSEFKITLNEYVYWCKDLEVPVDYCKYLISFPGIGGNRIYNGWGGYSEAYAAIYAYNLYYNRPMPEQFIKFYNN